LAGIIFAITNRCNYINSVGEKSINAETVVSRRWRNESRHAFSYKEPFSHEKARAIIVEGNGKHFDPDVVACFVANETEFESIWSSLNFDNE
jgi:hypothetical protein